MWRIDFHVHSCYSKDSAMSQEEIIKACKDRGLNCIALTDHNELEGALEMEKSGLFRVIAGEEIKTADGEIIGLFLKEKIRGGLSPEETVRQIRAQDGLVYIPHPFSKWRRTKLKISAIEKIKHDIDIMEVFNGRNFFRADNLKAEEYALKNNITMAVGSDSHITCELGSCYVEVEDFSTPAELLTVLKHGHRVTNLSSAFVHFGSAYVRIRKNLEKILLKKQSRMG
ncbi:MAG: PHP domain-containing protein [Candidatus Eremiobacterota bacterium]